MSVVASKHEMLGPASAIAPSGCSARRSARAPRRGTLDARGRLRHAAPCRDNGSRSHRRFPRLAIRPKRFRVARLSPRAAFLRPPDQPRRPDREHYQAKTVPRWLSAVRPEMAGQVACCSGATCDRLPAPHRRHASPHPHPKTPQATTREITRRARAQPTAFLALIHIHQAAAAQPPSSRRRDAHRSMLPTAIP